ncbi:hypothetical protein H1D32_10345 [Anaerobacillus sp. CMMVII]|nr:hypothetical protein [Anaerobacillus sp. CMMVII]MCT8138120.1 hypothetical protein [Anaerobacillus sp. CMMVII]
MKDKVKKFNEKKSELDEVYGVEPEMSLQNAKFSTTDNEYLSEYGDKKNT